MSEETKTAFDDAPAIVVREGDSLVEKLAEMREAQAKFATFTQEQVDKIFYAAALAANAQRIAASSSATRRLA